MKFLRSIIILAWLTVTCAGLSYAVKGHMLMTLALYPETQLILNEDDREAFKEGSKDMLIDLILEGNKMDREVAQNESKVREFHENNYKKFIAAFVVQLILLIAAFALNKKMHANKIARVI